MRTSIRAPRAGIRNAAIWRLGLCVFFLAINLAGTVAEALTLTAVHSRKIHGADTFDLPIDVTQSIGGLVTVEPRAIGTGHKIVFQFDAPVALPGTATATDENGAPIGTVSAVAAGNEVVVTLTGVPDNSRVKVSLSNVNSAGVNVLASLGFLVGDVDDSRTVTATDLQQMKARSGRSAISTNFMFDVNTTGAITASDILAVKSRAGQVLPVALVIYSLSTLSAPPATVMTITGAGFNPSAILLVQFSNAQGYSVKVPPVAASSTSIQVSVPPLTNVATGALAAGTVSVQVMQITAQRTVNSNAIGGLQVSALPTSASVPGTVTLQYLTAARTFSASTLQSAVIGTTLDTAELKTALANQKANLDILIPQIQTLVNDPTKSFTIGTISNTPIVVTSAHLSKVDRIILGVLAAQSVSTTPALRFSVSASGTSTASLSAVSSGCQAPEASVSLDQFITSGNPDVGNLVGYYGASKTSVNCKTATAVNTGLGVVAGAGGFALGVLALAGAPLEAVALPAAAVLYVTFATASGEIAVGGGLGQTSSDAAMLVQNGMRTLDELGTALLVKAAAGGALLKLNFNPEPLAALASMWYGAAAVHTAFTKAPPFNGGGTSGTNFMLTVSNSGNGSGTISSFPGGIICGGGSLICSGSFPSGTTVFLNPGNSTGSGFGNWSGACSGSGFCQVAMNSNQSATAVFNTLPACTYTYTSYSICQPNSMQTRSILSSSPPGCAGTPVLSQPCTYDCFAKYNVCIAQPACNPPSDLITQNQCINVCLSAYLSCT